MFSTVWVIGGDVGVVEARVTLNGLFTLYRVLSAQASGRCFSDGPSWRISVCLLRKSEDSVDTA